MCEGWDAEIQNLLIFAGLFSAIVGAYAIEAASGLQEPPEAPHTQLLVRISSQLESVFNSTTIPLPELEPFAPTASTLRVNVLWLISLTLSLAVVAIGILCLQWIREYQRQEPGRSHKESIAGRHSRYKSLTKWRIPFIISSLPVLLQLAFALFSIGLVDYYYDMNRMVGWVVGVSVALVMAVVVGTTILPGLHDFGLFFWWYKSGRNKSSSADTASLTSCAYKSPQAWGFTMFLSGVIALWTEACARLGHYSSTLRELAFVAKSCPNWGAYDRWWRETSRDDYMAALSSIAETFKETDPNIARAAHHCICNVMSVGEIHQASRLLPEETRRTFQYVLNPNERPIQVAKDFLVFEFAKKQVPVLEWEHLNRLELFVRLLEDLPPNLRLTVESACPRIWTGRDTDAILPLPQNLRIQLFKHFKAQLERRPYRNTPILPNMFVLLTTLVLDPLEESTSLTLLDSDTGEEAIPTPETHPRTFEMLDTGFRVLSTIDFRYHKHNLENYALKRWTSPAYRSTFIANQGLIVNSLGFWKFMGLQLREDPYPWAYNEERWEMLPKMVDLSKMTMIGLPQEVVEYLDEYHPKEGKFRIRRRPESDLNLGDNVRLERAYRGPPSRLR
ncbi:hypothetical protein CC1G_02125 [Coprinopsis cinerea okayama7|uniref:DUF6535 domain-containing protein n=1 Tax=Coprinopsis cinerea (strain Okayama-7 / 130 / ATCC MYA-4618 / FGSC 9003) TaxID=240176 RepID=A8NKA0_COPC7|nr:hypothetical protein CC1G_02125 [Coprinopsis cinerea okayama7\|eukprot:XP_001834389.1 hypothetical protein CC1G_02125 [Coprinopsis cinerea okayama7\